jgi:hypothetical protein
MDCNLNIFVYEFHIFGVYDHLPHFSKKFDYLPQDHHMSEQIVKFPPYIQFK